MKFLWYFWNHCFAHQVSLLVLKHNNFELVSYLFGILSSLYEEVPCFQEED